MNIGFYGHSNIAYTGDGSYLDIVADYFGATIVNTGVKQGSEERILFEIKKTKHLDVAVIAHSHPSCVFLPNCNRDISMLKIDEERIDYLSEHDMDFANVFGSTKNLKDTLRTYQSHFYNSDLHNNRFVAAAQQIVDYLAVKNVVAVHILHSRQFPPFLSFGKGIVNIDDITNVFKLHEKKRPFFHNCISKEGNKIVADKLIEILRPVVR
jgi:hypothetical protein